jgi:hypothetical protein
LLNLAPQKGQSELGFKRIRADTRGERYALELKTFGVIRTDVNEKQTTLSIRELI